jgi:hypothetical protein
MLRSLLFGSVLASVLVVGCATSPSDDGGVDLQGDPSVNDTSASEPDAGGGGNTYKTYDSGPSGDASTHDAATAAHDSGAQAQDSSSSSADSAIPPHDSGSTGADAATTSTGVACDMSNAFNIGFYFAEAAAQSQSVPCPCGANECCYGGLTCVAK